jgi:hypothetical protein
MVRSASDQLAVGIGGRFNLVPAGTIHAIGARVCWPEQNRRTYRLYDYGRPRKLHLDEGIRLQSRCLSDPTRAAPIRRIRAPSWSHFTLLLTDEDASNRVRWVPLDGEALGECLLLGPGNFSCARRGADWR